MSSQCSQSQRRRGGARDDGVVPDDFGVDVSPEEAFVLAELFDDLRQGGRVVAAGQGGYGAGLGG